MLHDTCVCVCVRVTVCVCVCVCMHAYCVCAHAYMNTVLWIYGNCSLGAALRFRRRHDSSIAKIQAGHADSSVSPVEQGNILNDASLIA